MSSTPGARHSAELALTPVDRLALTSPASSAPVPRYYLGTLAAGRDGLLPASLFQSVFFDRHYGTVVLSIN